MKRLLSSTSKPKVIGAVTTAVAIAVAAVAMMGPGSANASVAEGYVGGTGAVDDDWKDEGTLSTNQHSHSNAVGLWQWILYVDGATKGPNGSRFSKSDIDCDFGENTKAATKIWQKNHGFTGNDVDGIVGNQTFGKANKQLRVFEGNELIYNGTFQERSFFVNRIDGKYVKDGARIVYSGFSESFCSN